MSKRSKQGVVDIVTKAMKWKKKANTKRRGKYETENTTDKKSEKGKGKNLRGKVQESRISKDDNGEHASETLVLTKAGKLDIDDIIQDLRLSRPNSKAELHNYIKVFLGVDVPQEVVTKGHKSLMDYIWFSFNVDFEDRKRQNGDCVVWASRGGGKTIGSAILSTLDCVFKPEIEIRILSGSGYQAGRMYEYYQDFMHKSFEDMISDDRNYPVRKMIMKNGASVEVILQTETSVRGQHVHKLRCDEVELFREKVYEASQYTTMSSKGYIAAREVISTKHRNLGLMDRILKESERLGQPVFKWNVWDVSEKCLRRCRVCPLEDYCQGKAKKSSGYYYKIDDAITQFERAGKRSFNMEMLCGEFGKKKGIWNFGSRMY